MSTTIEEEYIVENSINELLNLLQYSLPTLEINYNTDEEAVADIFVRVNSGGQTLTENNFIQTLISVYENETMDLINSFSEKSRIPADNSSYNNLIEISPSHLIRMVIGFGFHRAKLKYAYMLLRGKNLDTGKFSKEERQDNLNRFKEALDRVMNLNNWHAFINILGEAGYINEKQIFPKNYLSEIGFTTDRERNQLANFTYLDYATNIDISDKAPSKYISDYKIKLGEQAYKKACEDHALPENFENMDYIEFLKQRRELMAQIVKKAYMKLCE